MDYSDLAETRVLHTIHDALALATSTDSGAATALVEAGLVPPNRSVDLDQPDPTNPQLSVPHFGQGDILSLPTGAAHRFGADWVLVVTSTTFNRLDPFGRHLVLPVFSLSAETTGAGFVAIRSKDLAWAFDNECPDDCAAAVAPVTLSMIRFFDPCAEMPKGCYRNPKTRRGRLRETFHWHVGWADQSLCLRCTRTESGPFWPQRIASVPQRIVQQVSSELVTDLGAFRNA